MEATPGPPRVPLPALLAVVTTAPRGLPAPLMPCREAAATEPRDKEAWLAYAGALRAVLSEGGLGQAAVVASEYTLALEQLAALFAAQETAPHALAAASALEHAHEAACRWGVKFRASWLNRASLLGVLAHQYQVLAASPAPAAPALAGLAQAWSDLGKEAAAASPEREWAAALGAYWQARALVAAAPAEGDPGLAVRYIQTAIRHVTAAAALAACPPDAAAALRQLAVGLARREQVLGQQAAKARLALGQVSSNSSSSDPPPPLAYPVPTKRPEWPATARRQFAGQLEAASTVWQHQEKEQHAIVPVAGDAARATLTLLGLSLGQLSAGCNVREQQLVLLAAERAAAWLQLQWTRTTLSATPAATGHGRPEDLEAQLARIDTALRRALALDPGRGK